MKVLRLIALLFLPVVLLWAQGAPADVPATSSVTAAPDYRLSPRDLVQFQIYEEIETQVVQRISESGQISVPMLGNVSIAGLTLREAERNLAKAYVDGGFFVKPQVILSVQAYAPRKISVLGQVNKPDYVDIPIERDSMGVVQAITLAGGFTRVARTDSVRIMRTVRGKEEIFTINVAAYLDAKTPTEEFRLVPDDVVFVPERVF